MSSMRCAPRFGGSLRMFRITGSIRLRVPRFDRNSRSGGRSSRSRRGAEGGASGGYLVRGDAAQADRVAKRLPNGASVSRRRSRRHSAASTSTPSPPAPRVETLIYGPGDYAASLQMPMDVIGVLDENDARYPGHRWHTIMQSVVVAARAYGKRCMDGPYAGLRDMEGSRRRVRLAG